MDDSMKNVFWVRSKGMEFSFSLESLQSKGFSFFFFESWERALEQVGMVPGGFLVVLDMEEGFPGGERCLHALVAKRVPFLLRASSNEAPPPFDPAHTLCYGLFPRDCSDALLHWHLRNAFSRYLDEQGLSLETSRSAGEEPSSLDQILDIQQTQALMDALFQLTHTGIGVLGMDGQVLVGTGWQRICTEFHRVNPQACQNCRESDRELSEGVEPGTFKMYHCKNNMWDISTPLVVNRQKMGNIFLGQFFFEEEQVDEELFRRQAKRYGFPEKEYMEALRSVPRFSRKWVQDVMTFYSRFAHFIVDLGYSKWKLKAMAQEKGRLVDALRESEKRWQYALEGSELGVWDWDVVQDTLFVSKKWKQQLGFQDEELEGSRQEWEGRVHPDDFSRVRSTLQKHLDGNSEVYSVSHRLKCKDGKYRWFLAQGKIMESDAQGRPTRVIGTHLDITPQKAIEKKLENEVHNREMLLRELQHRIKNSLSLIANLVSLEALRLDGGDVCESLRAIRNRILSLSQLYSLLLQSGMKESVHLDTYLEKIVGFHRDSFSGEKKIAFHVELQQVQVHPDFAMPLGMILNELLTNSLKYGFEGRHSGEIRILLHAENHGIRLCSSDNGRGFPEGFCFEKAHGLGLELIKDLSLQLSGECSWTPRNPTTFCGRYPLPVHQTQ